MAGETRDTVEMGLVMSLLANAHFTRAERTRLFRTWGGGIGMLPMGGPAIWGNVTWAPDDSPQLRKRGTSYGSGFCPYSGASQTSAGAVWTGTTCNESCCQVGAILSSCAVFTTGNAASQSQNFLWAHSS